ncbi:cholecystokinin [Denticeps clupeoides]|uniref:Gastrin/cholecystokinin peptide hormone domain-containing protein n=1 Tax=Denticeps clupeoides TaxID=299321 RepID=A0AAY4BDX1_9TELE|nr:cholecystokinin [Denticeps clupeoides]
MNSGLCVCVLLAALTASCLGRPHSVAPARQARSAPGNGLPQPHPDDAAETKQNLSQLLAKIMSMKGSVRRNSTLNSRVSGGNANHRIKDRDYLGWMDFGRRSAEEYEYSS